MSLFPTMVRIRLHFEAPVIENVAGELLDELSRADLGVKSGMKVGIAVGSRGIANLSLMVKTLVSFLRQKSAEPVIIPAMGSHGGATAEGQKQVLASYGITEEYVQAPIASSMETVCLGYVRHDIPVYFDRIAASLDGIILLNRVKPHTDFHATYESGLVKQMVIGLGNHRGAQLVHSYGVLGLQELIPEMGALILARAPILGGVAVVENAKDQTAIIKVLTGEEILREEPGLLEKARQLMPRLPVSDIDLLVVEEMGKNISGVGMDPNITGRMGIRLNRQPEHPTIRRIVCLDLTPESHGNALGVGLADVIPSRLADKIDYKVTYANVITSTFLERGFIPIVQPSDQAAMETALRCAGRKVSAENARIVQIKNTLELTEMFISRPLIGHIDSRCRWEKLEEFDYAFSPEGELLNRLGAGA